MMSRCLVRIPFVFVLLRAGAAGATAKTLEEALAIDPSHEKARKLLDQIR